MLFRMTIANNPFLVFCRLGHMLDWYVSVRHPLRFARVIARQRSERRRLVRERRISQEEEYWIRLASMTDAQAVGLDRDR